MKHWLIGLALIGAFGVMGGARAFDTGHHADLTREAMAEFGMSNDAIGVAQVENWLVDYYSNQPTAGLEDELGRLHFDNLDTTDKVRNYWWRLTINTRSAVRAAAIGHDPLKVVALTGMSLHAVQDFYTHSNWVEMQRAAANPANYSTRTWFDATPGPGVLTLWTGKYPAANPAAPLLTDHGNYTVGMNHDSYVRPRWDEAYVYGWNGSRQWIASIQRWVNEADPTGATWTSVRTLALSQANRDALQRDLGASHWGSEWITLKGQDGHWKGNRSGSGAAFLKSQAAWMGKGDSIFVNHFKIDHWYHPLAGTLNATLPGVAVPAIAPVPPITKKVIRVRTLSVDELPVGKLELRVNTPFDPNYYARIAIDGQSFIEAMQLSNAHVQPAWYTLRFIDRSDFSATIRYELLSQNSGGNYPCDINPIANKQYIDCTLNMGLVGDTVSGDIVGNAGATLTSAGVAPGRYRAQVQLVIDSLPLVP